MAGPLPCLRVGFALTVTKKESTMNWWMRSISRPLWALGLVCAPLAALSATADYVFEPLFPQADQAQLLSMERPALSPTGVAAMYVDLPGNKQALFSAQAGGPYAALATSAQFDRFGGVDINASGQVAFEGSPAGVIGEGIFRRDGEQLVRIAGTRDAGDFDFVNTHPSINRRGAVAFVGERIVGGSYISGVWIGDGRAVRSMFDELGAFSDFAGNPALNDRGEVAFQAVLDSGVIGVFKGKAGAYQTVADNTSDLHLVFGFSDPAINDRGDVAFMAGTNLDGDGGGGATGFGVYVWRDGVLRTVLQQPLSEVFSMGQPAINNRGGVAFIVEPRYTEQILVTGPDPLLDRVIGRGDRLGGRVVKGVLFGRDGLNDAGQVAFVAVFSDGSTRAYLATPKVAQQR